MGNVVWLAVRRINGWRGRLPMAWPSI